MAQITAFNEPSTWPETLRQQWKWRWNGYATPYLSEIAFTCSRASGMPKFMQALDVATGKTIWRTDYPARSR
jgi:hypothetical protein